MATKSPSQLVKKQEFYQEQLTKYTELRYLGRVYWNTREETANLKSVFQFRFVSLVQLSASHAHTLTHTQHSAWTQKVTTTFEFPQAHKKR